LIVAWPVERIGGQSPHSHHPRDNSPLSVVRPTDRTQIRWPVAGNPRGLFGFYQHRTTLRATLLLLVVEVVTAA
jgi:hypothetical protein